MPDVSLNPCSTGITFLTTLTSCKTLLLKRGLNPCSTGITFLTIKENAANLVGAVKS